MAKRLAEFQKYKFINPDPTLKNNLMAFGFEIGDGWIPIMRELCEKIQAEIDSDPEAYKDLEFTQVKEKWGGLRVYLNYYYPKIEELVDDAEAKSFETCEVCGKPGKLREDRSWIVTLCDECNEKEK
jgi:hypothetical protein